jgi:hypothetical protein
MEIDFIKLAELKEGERPYKGYYIPLEKGYVRLMSSRLDREGQVVAVNYYGKAGAGGTALELRRVIEKRQKVEDFEADLARFKDLLEKSGLKIFIKEL